MVNNSHTQDNKSHVATLKQSDLRADTQTRVEVTEEDNRRILKKTDINLLTTAHPPSLVWINRCSDMRQRSD
ncbi:hypothetical protein PM082_010223 [Marasmius tenuissimus]|nr:hypothetical protein PM082_010223 [Marasmius tenuissimus]